MREILRAYQNTVAGEVARFDGHVAKFMGDGVLVYFGYPRAHEDDAERAARAGLDIIEAVGAIKAAGLESLQARIGIATGRVVVGDLVGEGAAQEEAVVGETPNLAARLQALAGPDAVVISPSTRRLLGRLFECEDLGEQHLKGIGGGVRPWRVVRERPAESRFEARQAAGLIPFVGRDQEIELLLHRWQLARQGEGQVVLLSGEPGIGKSRITETLRDRIGDQLNTRIRYQCSPYHTNSAFYPIIYQLEQAAQFERNDTPEQKLDKLEALLALPTEYVGDVAPLLAAFLSLPLDRYPPLDLSPQMQKEHTIRVLTEHMIALSHQRPVLMIFEDVHWVDPTTLESLSAVIDSIQDAAVLVVVTHRPEFQSPWAGYGHTTTLTLNRLSRGQGADIVAEITGGKTLPEEVLAQIVAKTDGVPLFVEELTKTVLEAGILKDTGEAYELDGPLPPLAIPATLQDSLMARLDRLSLAKEVAQIGACIGREVSYELLAEVSPLGDNELREALTELVNSGLIFARGGPPATTYTFKHGTPCSMTWWS